MSKCPPSLSKKQIVKIYKMKNLEILFLYQQGEADYPRALYSDRTESNRILKPTTTPIFCPQRKELENSFLKSMKFPKITHLRGWGRFWKVFMKK